jgi:hypothetical protein
LFHVRFPFKGRIIYEKIRPVPQNFKKNKFFLDDSMWVGRYPTHIEQCFLKGISQPVIIHFSPCFPDYRVNPTGAKSNSINVKQHASFEAGPAFVLRLRSFAGFFLRLSLVSQQATEARPVSPVTILTGVAQKRMADCRIQPDIRRILLRI